MAGPQVNGALLASIEEKASAWRSQGVEPNESRNGDGSSLQPHTSEAIFNHGGRGRRKNVE